MTIGKPLAEVIELFHCHPSETMVQKPLLCALIGISAHAHQYEPRQYAKQGKNQSQPTLLVYYYRHH